MSTLRIARERRTLQAMIELYCRGVHRRGDLCEECSTLSAYARSRLDGCRFADAKPVCSRCVVHCYRPPMRDAVRAVMRYAGPRMLLSHPLLALAHVVDGWRSG